jgi:hypothetical protein
MIRPWVQAATTIQAFNPTGQNINFLVAELSKQAEQVVFGENLARPEAQLVCQAHTLDEIFNKLARRAEANFVKGYLDAGERFLRMALRAQNQCRATIETLAVLKNPAPVAFVRQANIAAGPQQVNNGVPAGSDARAGEFGQSKLGVQNGQQLDTRAARQGGCDDPQVAALGALDGAKNS